MYHQQLKYKIFKWLETERGLNSCGRFACGKPYAMQARGKGWVAPSTFCRPHKLESWVEDNE